jgi:uncharacterized protein YecE (DUF72 family)
MPKKKISRKRLYIGTSGWNYPHWEERFYPKGLGQDKWLDYYSRYFDTVEINLTFYRLPEKAVFKAWGDESPEGFSFVAKASRFFTHMKKLNNPQTNLVRFLQNAEGLRDKLRLVLFQLPPYWKVNKERLKRLVEYMANQSFLKNVKSVLEVRHESWLDDEVFDILKEANWSLCFADWPRLTVEEPVTADFIYVRRHGPGSLYSSCYTEEMLKRDASRISEWLKKDMEVYVYFNNDAYGYAIKNALRLKELLSKEIRDG